jgi:outer membrane receptor protein involved in Fe transport
MNLRFQSCYLGVAALFVAAFFMVPGFCVGAWGQASRGNSREIKGVVRDPSGAGVAGAEVSMTSGPARTKTTTGSDGSFRLQVQGLDSGTVEAHATGFGAASQHWSAGGGEVVLSLPLAPVAETVTVVSRSPVVLSESTGSVSVLSAEQFNSSGALALDDVLRRVPGFSLFRRSGSRTSNPTTMGVSLRGVGASGASRALVLQDGIPLSDPFGGWVYWDRIPRMAVERVEVGRGGASSLYGSDALGGVIGVQTRRFTQSGLAAETFMGTSTTPSGSMVGTLAWGKWNATASGEGFRTDGYIPVSEAERGPVDDVSSSEHAVGNLRLGRSLGEHGSAFLEGSMFGDSRKNGTILQRNGATIRQLSAGANWDSSQAGSFVLRAYGGTESFRQNFTSISIDRTVESLIRDQHVPVTQIGGSAQWSRAFGFNYVVLGTDVRNVEGETEETAITNSKPTSLLQAGGRQSTVGFFFEDLIHIGTNWFVTVSGRVDHWNNLDASSLTRPLSAVPPTLKLFPDRHETAFSPRLGISRRLGENATISVSGYRSFRAPTLNELYRGFRVGNVNTLANENLLAERLTGAEASFGVRTLNRRLDLRTTYFYSRVNRPVGNITLSSTAALITRQRQNIGRTHAEGIELEGRYTINNRMTVGAGYQFADSKVEQFPSNTALVGLLLPQTPRHQFTTDFTYADPRKVTFSLQGRYLGQQFDDDVNQLPLEHFFNLDASVARPVTHNVELFAAAENLLNSRYSIGRTPVRTIAPPVFARVGVRFTFGESGHAAP